MTGRIAIVALRKSSISSNGPTDIVPESRGPQYCTFKPVSFGAGGIRLSSKSHPIQNPKWFWDRVWDFE